MTSANKKLPFKERLITLSLLLVLLPITLWWMRDAKVDKDGVVRLYWSERKCRMFCQLWGRVVKIC